MRTYVLTDREREIINVFLATGQRLEGFKVLLHRIRNLDRDRVKTDLELIERLLKIQ